MSRRIWLDVICDGCGLRQSFEVVDTAAMVATTSWLHGMRMQGWVSLPIQGSQIRQQDFCPKCYEDRGRRSERKKNMVTKPTTRVMDQGEI